MSAVCERDEAVAESILVAIELGGREGELERERDAHHQPESAVTGRAAEGRSHSEFCEICQLHSCLWSLQNRLPA